MPFETAVAVTFKIEKKKINRHGFLQKPYRFFQSVLAETVGQGKVQKFICDV